MVTAFPLRLPNSRLIRDIMTTYAGFLANAVFGFVTLTLMARHMGPGDFGVAMLANMFMSVVAGFGEPGIGIALVRLAARPGVTSEEIDELIVAAVRLKLIVVAGLGVIAYLLIPWITGLYQQYMRGPEITHLLRWSLLGGASLSLWIFAGAVFQIKSAFRDNAATIAAASAVRMSAVLALCWSGQLNLRTAVGSMVLMNLVQFCLCIYALRGVVVGLPWGCRTRRRIGELAHYAKYLVVWFLVGTIHPRADTLILPHYVGKGALGFYSFASQLCLVIPMLTGSLNMVLLPRISALRTRCEMMSVMRQCGLGALVAFAILSPAALAAAPIVRAIFPQYAPAIPVFRVLLFAAAAELALNPLSNFWHALNRPVMLSALNVARLSLLAAIAIIAIPRIGIMGAALAVIVSTVLPLAGQGVILWVTIKRQSSEISSQGPAAAFDLTPVP